MKTKFFTIVATVILAVVTSSNTFAANNDTREEQATVLTNISRINKIEVYGNVELFVSDGTADQVKVYNKYYAENALVQSKDGVLRISSYADKKLVVWVTAADLRAITANDNAEVKSFGSLSAIQLDVTLNNSASAKLDLDAHQANITLKNRATANLTGSVTNYTVDQDQSSTVNQTNLVAEYTTSKVNKFAKVSQQQELVTL